MNVASLIALVLLTLIALGAVGFWFRVAAVARAIARDLPTPRADAPASSERVCVLVPAHNEARNIQSLVRSLLAQDHQNLRFILALDRCTDDTAALARREFGDDPRFTILEIDSCPQGWSGRVHALHRAAEGAPPSDYLLFMDADVQLAPQCIRAALALAKDRSLDLLSLITSPAPATWWEHALEPAAGMELLTQNPLSRTNNPDRPRGFANGQFMLFRASAYQRLGGHAPFREALLDDLAMARATVAASLRLGVFLANGLAVCRMYNSLKAFVKGWKRIYTESGGRKPVRLQRWALRASLTGLVLPIGAMASLVSGVLSALGAPSSVELGFAVFAALAGALGVIAWQVGVGAALSLGGTSRLAAPLHLVGSAVVVWMLSRAADDLLKGRPTTWGGREYHITART